MDRQKMTFFIVHNPTGETKKVVLSTFWVKVILGISAIFALALVAGVLDYFGLLLQASENKRLKVENAQLTKQFQGVESKLEALESSLDRVKTFTTKLKLITNIDSEERNLKLSMGAVPGKGQQVDEYDTNLEDRPPLDANAEEDKGFLLQPPVDENRGELVVQGSRDYATLVVRIEGAIRESQLREQSILDLWESLSERQSLLNATPNIKPARGWLTSRFGYRVSPFTLKPTLHTGLDIAANPGTPVYAPADGIVSFVGYDEGYGKLVSIDHGYGITTRFGHNSQLYVQLGQRVSRWDVIAAIGNTGRSTGPHLHYEVRVNGVPKDPSLYILDD